MHQDQNHTSCPRSGDAGKLPKKRRGKTAALEAVLAQKEAELADLQVRYEELRRSGLDERSQVQLRSLFHLHARLINLSCFCPEDQESIDKLLDEIHYIVPRRKT
jgi:hypothetical protein